MGNFIAGFVMGMVTLAVVIVLWELRFKKKTNHKNQGERRWKFIGLKNI